MLPSRSVVLPDSEIVSGAQNEAIRRVAVNLEFVGPLRRVNELDCVHLMPSLGFLCHQAPLVTISQVQIYIELRISIWFEFVKLRANPEGTSRPLKVLGES
jgi:hypothetical protein